MKVHALWQVPLPPFAPARDPRQTAVRWSSSSLRPRPRQSPVSSGPTMWWSPLSAISVTFPAVLPTCRRSTKGRRGPSWGWMSTTGLLRSMWCRRRRSSRWPNSKLSSRMPASCIWPRTRIAKAKPLRGTCSKCSSLGCRCAEWCSTKSPEGPSSAPWMNRVTWTRAW